MHLTESTKALRRHFTVTGYVMNRERTKLLMIHHNKLGKWLPPGGHLEENELPHEGALREVLEETGIAANIVSAGEHDLGLEGGVDVQIPRPYALMYQLIPEGKKDTEHIHLDMVYALEADEHDGRVARLEEVSDVQWRTKSQILLSEDTFESAKGFAKSNLVKPGAIMQHNTPLPEAEFRQQAKNDGITHLSTGVAVLRDGKILMVRRAANDFLGGVYELPGGGIDEGESIANGAIRELKEETGLTATKILATFDGFDYSTDRKPHVRQINFLVEVEPGAVVLSPDEHDEFIWVDERDISDVGMSQNMRRCVTDALKSIP